jgi:hypothetical protein
MMPTRTLETRKLLTRWPSGDSKPVLLLRLTPDIMTERYGLEFSRERDDLDWRDASFFIDDVLGPVVLTWYGNAPVKGMDCTVDAGVGATAAISRLIDVLGLVDDDIVWRRDATAD